MATSGNSDSDIKLQWLELPRLGTAPSTSVASMQSLAPQAKPSSSAAPARKRKRSLESLSDDSSLSDASDIDDAAVEVHLQPTAGGSGPSRSAHTVQESSLAGDATQPPADALAPPAADVLGDQMRKVQGRYYSISKASTSRCYRCKETGHYAMFCTSAPRRNPCWICGETDHDCRDCNADSCFVCDEAGHRWGACPNRAAMEREVLRLGYVPGYGRHLVMMTGPESSAMRLMPRRALMDGRGRSFQAVRAMMPAAQILVGQFCPLCAGEGHTASTCPHASRDMPLVQCVSCGARGHTFCTKHAQGTGAADVHSGASDMHTAGRINLAATPLEFKAGTCFNCGSGGHEGTQCPKARNHVLFDGSIGPQPVEEPRAGGYGNGGGRHDSYPSSTGVSQGDRGGPRDRERQGRYGYNSDSDEDSYDSYEERRIRKRGRVQEPSDDESDSDDDEDEKGTALGTRSGHGHVSSTHTGGNPHTWAPHNAQQDRGAGGSAHFTGSVGTAGAGPSGAPPGGASFAGTCYKCGRVGHRAMDCMQMLDPGAASQGPANSQSFGRGGAPHGQHAHAQARPGHNQPFQSTFHPGQGQYNKSGPVTVARPPGPPQAAARQTLHVRAENTVQVRVQFAATVQASQGQRHQANSSAGSDDEGGERDPWYMRDPVAQKERHRIMSSSASAADKKLQIAKLRKTVKKNEKRSGK